jgi:uncharacterized protein YchJ
MQRSFLNQLGIFGTAVSVIVVVLCFHLLYSTSYLSKTHSPDQQTCQSLARQTKGNTNFSFLSLKGRVLQQPNNYPLFFILPFYSEMVMEIDDISSKTHIL